MHKDNIKLILNQLSNLLFLPKNELEQLLTNYEIKEKRKRNFYWIAFFFVNLKCLINGKSRHKDRLALYHELYNIKLSANAFSDRLSQLPTDFCAALLKEIQKHINKIPNNKKRTKATNMINTLLAEDSTQFRLDKRLLESFGTIGSTENAVLKLYLNINVLGDVRLDSKIGRGNSHDATHKGFEISDRNRAVELRDRAWFGYELFSKWKSEGRNFISCFKKGINPVILKVNKGDKSIEHMKFQEIIWDEHAGEVDIEIMPIKQDKKSPYSLKDGTKLTLNLRGYKIPSKNKWFWYIYHLPNAKELSFNDIHSLYRARWQIEECFREIKQCLGGDSIRLRHPKSLLNHILMMLIAYLICRGYLMKISNVQRKSVKGFMLDTCLKNSLGELFKGIIFNLVKNPDLSNRKLKEMSDAFCNAAYSSKRARSERIINLGKAMKKLNA